MQKTTLCYIGQNHQYLMLHRIRKKQDANRDKWIGIGGHFEREETPEECMLREVKEETGLTLKSWKLRGLIDFVSDYWQEEEMYLFTSEEFEGELTDCDEGCLEWVDKDRLAQLNLWEGDYIFLNLLDEREDYFSLRLEYQGERLIGAALDGKPMELFDVCDEEGNPTGQTRERSLAHRYGTPHRTSHVWITRRNSDNSVDILLQKRSADKDSFPGCFDISSAGHIPAGCEWRESAVRELEEELGISVSPEDLEYVGKVTSEENCRFHGKPFHNREISAVYLYRKPVDEAGFRLQPEEVEAVMWMNLRECIRAVSAGEIPNCINLVELSMLENYLNRR